MAGPMVETETLAQPVAVVPAPPAGSPVAAALATPGFFGGHVAWGLVNGRLQIVIQADPVDVKFAPGSPLKEIEITNLFRIRAENPLLPVEVVFHLGSTDSG